MVAGMWTHLTSLRQMRHGYCPKIRTLIAEAENERMHLMTFIEIAKPNWFERYLVLFAQAVFWNVFFVIYVFFPRTAHRIVGYFEEEAVYSYTEYLKEIDEGRTPNIPAPQIAIDYWKLPANATLRDVVLVVREDEAGHRDANHAFASEYDRPREN
jgi:ubiquinol oxidase